MERVRNTIGVVVFGLLLSACGGGGSSGGDGGGGAGGGTQPPASFTVSTATAGNGAGTISPGSRTVTSGGTTSFTISPALGSTIASVSGCGGTLSGTTYTTGAINSACTVTVTFNVASYLVTATASSGGSISPDSVNVTHGNTTTFSVTPDSGYEIDSVSGCGGTLSGNTYTTGEITAACSVSASFRDPSGTPPTLATYTVTTSISGAGSGSVSPSAVTVQEGQTATFEVVPDQGSTIEGVTGCGGSLSGTTYTTAAIDQACEVHVNFGELTAAWQGTIRLGQGASAYTHYGIAAHRNDEFVVAYSSDKPQDGSAIVGGRDIVLARFDNSGTKLAINQISREDSQTVYEVIPSGDGNLYISFLETLDTDSKQVPTAGASIDANWSRRVDQSSFIAIEAEITEPTVLSQIDLFGVHPRGNGGNEEPWGQVWARVVRVADDGSFVSSGTLISILEFDEAGRSTLDGVLSLNGMVGVEPGRYLIVFDYSGNGDGFDLDTETSSAGNIWACSLNDVECWPRFSRFGGLERTNQSMAYRLYGVVGTSAPRRYSLLKTTPNAEVLWEWSAPPEVSTIYRMVTDPSNNLFMIALRSSFAESSRILSFSPHGALRFQFDLAGPDVLSQEDRPVFVGRSLIVSSDDLIVVGGHLGRSQGSAWHPHLAGFRQDGTTVWTVAAEAWADMPPSSQVQFVTSTQAGFTGFTRSETRAVRIDPLGAFVASTNLELTHPFFYGRSSGSGRHILTGNASGPNGQDDWFYVASVSRTMNVEWELDIIPEGYSWGLRRNGGAIFLEDGSVLLLVSIQGNLPGSPADSLNDIDVAVIRISADGVPQF